MRIALPALASVLVLGVLLATPFACRHDDGTTPSPTGPVQPSAAAPGPSATSSATGTAPDK